MKTFASLAVGVLLLGAFAIPSASLAVGNIPQGGDCTGNPSGCSAGFYCVPGDYGSVCSNTSTGNTTPIADSNLRYYRDLIVGTINGVLVPVLLAVAFILFLWGVFKYYIKGADNEAERAKGHQFILWGVIGFVVIFSVWGLVNILQSILIPGGASNVRPNYPTL